MYESDEIRTMRYIAWQRSKGELESVLCTYWGNMESMEKINKLTQAFIKTVEDDGLIE